MNERIKELRNALQLTQQAFADKMGMPRNNIAGYETGRRTPSDAAVSLICREFNVSETWLRTGEGEMFLPISRNENIAVFAGNLMKEEDESFKKRLIEALAKLDEHEWEVLEGIAKKLIKKD